LNQQLVEKGLAWWSDKYAPNDKTLKDLFHCSQSTEGWTMGFGYETNSTMVIS